MNGNSEFLMVLIFATGVYCICKKYGEIAELEAAKREELNLEFLNIIRSSYSAKEPVDATNTK